MTAIVVYIINQKKGHFRTKKRQQISAFPSSVRDSRLSKAVTNENTMKVMPRKAVYIITRIFSIVNNFLQINIFKTIRRTILQQTE